MAVINMIGSGAETNVRQQNGDVLARNKAHEKDSPTAPGGAAPIREEDAGLAPDNYMLLVSRLGAQVGSSRKDAAMLANLQRIITLRLTTMPPGARKAVLDIPETRPMGAANAMELPRIIARRLADSEGEAEVMALLRSPAFAAVMREENRTTTYSLHGRLGALA